MKTKLRIIVSGLIVQYPLGGLTWHYLNYLLGFARLGHDVYYLEDTGQHPYSPSEIGLTEDPTDNVEYLRGVLAKFGLEDRWAYRFPRNSRWFGLPEGKRKELVRSADLLVNVSGTLARPSLYRGVSRLAYIDTDPVFTQVKLALGQRDLLKLVEAHDVLFSFGESLPENLTEHRWLPTRQPVILSEWEPTLEHRSVFTTVMNWTSYSTLRHQGQSYGQKNTEFKAFLDLPAMVRPSSLELAVNPVGKFGRAPVDLLRHKGWNTVNPASACPDIESYRAYIRSSMAEWTVVKNGYVVGQPGWFSERSACYLAAGRPTLVQDTGLAGVLPIGEGILPFRTVEQAAEAIRRVESAYRQHSSAARAIAEAYFDSDKVLTELIERALANTEAVNSPIEE